MIEEGERGLKNHVGEYEEGVGTMVEVRSSPKKTAPAQRVLSQRGSFSSKI